MFYYNIDNKNNDSSCKDFSLNWIKLLSIFAIIFNGFLYSNFSIANTSGAGSDQQISLIDSNHPDYRLPREPIALLIENGLAGIENELFSYELDNIDISDVIQVDAGIATYTPIKPLSNGDHQLIVTKHLASGESLIIGEWDLTIHQSRLFEEYSVSANTQIISNYRLSEKNIGAPPPRASQTQGSSQVAFNATNGNWTTQGQFDLYYTSLKSNRPSDRTIENGEFVVSVENEFVNAVIGHQSVGQPSLIMNDFRRRGISVTGNIPLRSSQMTGFALSSGNISGFGHGLGISQSNQRVTGYQFQVNPFEENPDELTLTGTWIKGNGDDNFGLVSQFIEFGEVESAPSKGSAWSVKGSGFYLENKLQLEVEYAETKFDDNPLDTIETDNDSAYLLRTIYSDATEDGLSWNLGFNQQKVGTFFHSIANRNIASDRIISSISSNLQWSTMGIQSVIGKQKDNIEKLEQVPQIETNLGNLMFSWSPVLESQENWYGTPSFAIGYNKQSQKQVYSPIDYVFAATDNNVSSWQASGSFSYPSKSYSVNLSKVDFVDDSNIQDDSVTTGIDFSGNWLISETFNLSSSVRLDSTKNIISGITSDGITYSLQTSFTSTESAIDGSIGYLVNKNQTNDFTTDGINTSAEFTLNWHPYLPSANTFGVDISLSASYNDFDDKLFVFNSIETFQSFLTVTLLLPSYLGPEE